MNNVSLIGRLTADPELRHTQSGVAMTRFTVAVDRRVKQGDERQADFITCVAWNQRAEFISKYFSKGQRIALTGSIRTGSYTAQDGSKRYTTDVWVDNAEFCESKGSSSSNSGYGNSDSYGGGSYSRPNPRQEQPSAGSSYASGSADEFVEMPTDDDLPF